MFDGFCILFTPIVYACLSMFFFMTAAKLLMPYSKGVLVWLNKLLNKRIDNPSCCWIFDWNSHSRNIFAILGYSYDYSVDGEYKNK